MNGLDDMVERVTRQCRARMPVGAAHAAGLLLAILASVASVSPPPAQDFSYGRRLYLDKADCSFCHGWAGDGAGQPQSPGRAAKLRQSQLARDPLITVIQCGVPGTAMPRFDDLAYTDKSCYGMIEAELGDRVPPLPHSTSLQSRETEVLVDYLRARVVGRAPITREECFETLGERVRSCAEYPAAR